MCVGWDFEYFIIFLLQEQRRISPLKSWLCSHGKSSLEKFLDIKGDFEKPILFTAETPQRKFVAYIDPENQFCIEDKLSQVTYNYCSLLLIH